MSIAPTRTTDAQQTRLGGSVSPKAHDKRIRSQGTWQGSMRTKIRIRAFGFEVDEPEPVGGTDTAPTPMEYMVGAVNACLGVVVEQIAEELQIGLEAIETYCLATQDTRGFAGTADVQPFFHSCRIAVHVQTGEQDASRLDQLTTSVESRCPALTLIRAAGVVVDLRWHFAELIDVDAPERECNNADALSRGLDSRSRKVEQ
ncbi:MAG: OsmC family protein [Arthrobacter sp.]|uniref:OsmC family protein n=1 Tax=unclassified Arthrobacter TaxID=235627 RepID=UPI0026553BAD|nr:OsmC family protein [Micrococcaceae bacterium]MDN5824041.1 OsmC family protein [Micrococcaceae bacterium]MDN5877930.1 OsmC family protein [Micrococcaceae bacterium]MDN5887043.1 OsmC family protein [Micrococcaceae bacterium]MDN5906087.1 OsmC family protein [Micrococcaceae bacterium]